jgi:transcriptional regulator with XRE-family HTH domain
MDKPSQPPEGALIQRALKKSGLSIRALASRVDLSDARVRQYINGYTSAGRGQYVFVEAPADRLAAIAQALNVSPEELEKAGRADAAESLRARSVSDVSNHEPEIGFLTRVREDLTDEEWEDLVKEATPYIELLKRDVINRRRGDG